MRGRRHVVEIELRHLRDRLEDRVQLRAEAVDLVVGEREPGEPRDVEHLFAIDRRHRRILTKGTGLMMWLVVWPHGAARPLRPHRESSSRTATGPEGPAGDLL